MNSQEEEKNQRLILIMYSQKE